MINIVGTIYDNSSLHTVALANQVKDEDYQGGKKQSEINAEFNERLLELSAAQKNNKGLYNSVESLNETQPNPKVGDWALVQEGEDLIIYVCNVAGQWTRTGLQYQQELPDLSDYVLDQELTNTLNSYVTKQQYNEDMSAKLAVLQSGLNVKTINNESILGPGNIEITAGTQYAPATRTEDGLMSASNYVDLYTLKDTTIPHITDELITGLSTRILNIEDFLDGESSQEDMSVLEVLAAYNEIKLFIESLGSDDDRLLQIINNLSLLDDKIEAEELRAKDVERSLNTRAQNIEDRVSAIERNGSGGDGTKHVILSQTLYDELISYSDNTIYFIIEPESNTWTFGGTFPITFGTTFKFGGTFPVTLT